MSEEATADDLAPLVETLATLCRQQQGQLDRMAEQMDWSVHALETYAATIEAKTATIH